MDEYESLSHSKWECKYHVVFIPKCRRKTLYGELRPHLGDVFRKLALQKEGRVEEGHLMLDHVHMMISIPPKYAVSQVVGFIKGKSAIHLARVYAPKKLSREWWCWPSRSLRDRGRETAGNTNSSPTRGASNGAVGCQWYQGGDPSGPRHAAIVVSARYVPNTLLATADEVIE